MLYLLSQFMASENWIVREEAKIRSYLVDV